MVSLKCPSCGTLVSGEPGTTMQCPACGFRADVPPAAPPPSPRPVTVGQPTSARNPLPPPRPSGPETPALKNLGVWAYLLAILGIGTFFLVTYWLPFLLGAGGIGLGLTAYMQNKEDRRGLIAVGLGVVAWGLGAMYWVLL